MVPTVSVPIVSNSQANIPSQHYGECNREAVNKKKLNLQSTGHNYYITKTVKWLRGDGKSPFNQVLRRIAAVALAALLAISVIGIGVLITGIKEWKNQAIAVQSSRTNHQSEEREKRRPSIEESSRASADLDPVFNGITLKCTTPVDSEDSDDEVDASHDSVSEDKKKVSIDSDNIEKNEEEFKFPSELNPANAYPSGYQTDAKEADKKVSSISSFIFGQTAGNCTWNPVPSFMGLHPVHAPPAPPSLPGSVTTPVGSLGGRKVTVLSGYPNNKSPLTNFPFSQQFSSGKEMDYQKEINKILENAMGEATKPLTDEESMNFSEVENKKFLENHSIQKYVEQAIFPDSEPSDLDEPKPMRIESEPDKKVLKSDADEEKDQQEEIKKILDNAMSEATKPL